MNNGSLLIAAALAVSLVAVGFFSLSHQQAAAGGIDMSGEWDFNLDYAPCHAHIRQSGRDLIGDALCFDVLQLQFAGVIDPDSGRFAMCADGGVRVCLDGTATNTTMSGTVRETSSTTAYHLTGSRTAPTPTPWPTVSPHLAPDIVLSGGNCPIYLLQRGPALSGATGCFVTYPSRIAGTINEASGAFSFSWQVGSSLYTINGTLGSSSFNWNIELTPGAGTPIQTYMQANSAPFWGNPDCNFSAPPVGPPIPGPRPVTNGATDVLLLLQRTAGLSTRGTPCWYLSDVNIDGQVDAEDANLILQREAGLIPRLPVL